MLQKPTSILVTGVGGGVGQSVLKALQDTDYRTVGVDSEELAAGLHAVPDAYKGYYAVDPRFIDRLLEICHKEQCRLIFPGHDVELLPLAESVLRFRSEGIVPVVSSPEVVRVCDDKLATAEFLQSHGFPSPRTCKLMDLKNPEFPLVLKPQKGGARSRATYVARDAQELKAFRVLVDPDNCVAQGFLAGEEYTCGSVSFEGKCYGVIVMRRTLRAGDTYKAFVERNPVIENTVKRLVEALHPFGPCNVQLRLVGGTPVVFEINARCSGTTAARALVGFNEPLMAADYLLRSLLPSYSIREMTILRYWKELVVTNERVRELGETGHLPGNGTRL